MMQHVRMRFAKLMSLLALCHSVAATPSFAGLVEQRQDFGAIALVTQVYTRDPDQPLIMHVADEWKKLHLRWHSQDGKLLVNLTDDGGMLSIDAKSEAGCLLFAPYQRFRGTSGEPGLWQATTAAIRDLLRCSHVSRKAVISYVNELKQSEVNFSAGVEAMKGGSIVLFGTSLKRCRPKLVKPGQLIVADPFAERCGGLW